MTKQNPCLQKVWLWLSEAELAKLEQNKLVILAGVDRWAFKRKPINEKIVLRKETNAGEKMEKCSQDQ